MMTRVMTIKRSKRRNNSDSVQTEEEIYVVTTTIKDVLRGMQMIHGIQMMIIYGCDSGLQRQENQRSLQNGASLFHSVMKYQDQA